MSTLTLKIPESLHKSANELAQKEDISLDQFIVLALAEKIAALGAEEYLEKRARRASKAKFDQAMAKVAQIEPPDYDCLKGDKSLRLYTFFILEIIENIPCLN
ncbi:MAG: toxin-antitoxin system HicB family antitoxin [Herpetosiphon sp.]|nr:toxin-antitoxin system HicB family antitoxin [Herpetosiphon sp.]